MDEVPVKHQLSSLQSDSEKRYSTAGKQPKFHGGLDKIQGLNVLCGINSSLAY